MTQITDIKSRLIYNSRGSETIEVEVSIGNIIGTASSPAGASLGKFEAKTIIIPHGLNLRFQMKPKVQSAKGKAISVRLEDL